MTEELALVELFHSALDRQDVAGPFQRLRIELEKPGAARVRRGRRIVMTRNRLALLAAALVLILISGVLVGTHLLNRTTSEVPAGHPGIDQAEVMQLLARPLQFPALKPTDPCPDSTDSYGFMGPGPVYGQAVGIVGRSAWGAYYNVYVLTPPGMPGPVIVRSRDLTHGSPVLDIGPLGAGPVYGTDNYLGKIENQYQAVALDTTHATKGTDPVGNTDYVHWSWLQGFQHNWGGGCVGAQVDGPGFTELFYADVPTN